MKRVAVVLSGCGVFDGSEIFESVLTLLALDRAGASISSLAPNIQQHHVVDHVTQKQTAETRNVLTESARLVRGDIQDIATVSADQFDAAIYPGGFGAAKNLCDFAFQGSNCNIQAEVLAFGQAMAEAGKPQGFMCIASVMISQIYGAGVRQTVGHDQETINKIMAMGGIHEACEVDGVVIDQQHKVVSTPAYMLAKSIKEAATGIDRLVSTVLTL